MKRVGLLVKLILATFVITTNSSGQSITGEWIGSVEKYSAYCKKPKLHLTLKQSSGGNLVGYLTYDYGKEEYEKFAVSGTLDSSKGGIILNEDTLIETSLSDTPANSIVGKLFLKPFYPDSLAVLKGKWSDRSNNFIKANSFSVTFTKVDEVFPAFAERKNEIRDSLLLKYDSQDSIYIQVFDNGTIDNDTISLYLNETCLLSKQKISANPILVKFTIPNNSQELLLKLIAENYGDIPPN